MSDGARSSIGNILQIIPADGWYAVFAVKQANGEFRTEVQPVGCWGLVENNDDRDVIGIGPFREATWITDGTHAANLGYVTEEEVKLGKPDRMVREYAAHKYIGMSWKGRMLGVPETITESPNRGSADSDR